MYWIFFILFTIASATPLTISGSVFGIPEELAETIIIFLLGWMG